MIDALGPHAGFILASYGATILVVGVLIAWVILDHAAQRRRLADLEARGVRRRSARPAASAATSDPGGLDQAGAASGRPGQTS